MSEELYHRAILEAAAAGVGSGRLASPHGRARVDNPLCGDRVDFDVQVAEARVSALAHRVRGCLLCEAAASVIGRSACGATAAQLLAVRDEVSAMLGGGARHFSPPWEALEMFAPARDFPSRHECVTLAFDALSAALSDAESPEGRAGRGPASPPFPSASRRRTR